MQKYKKSFVTYSRFRFNCDEDYLCQQSLDREFQNELIEAALKINSIKYSDKWKFYQLYHLPCFLIPSTLPIRLFDYSRSELFKISDKLSSIWFCYILLQLLLFYKCLLNKSLWIFDLCITFFIVFSIWIVELLLISFKNFWILLIVLVDLL